MVKTSATPERKTKMKWDTTKLEALGFRRVMTTQSGSAFVRMKIVCFNEAEWAIGEAVIVTPTWCTRLQCAFDLAECKLEALGAIASDRHELAQIQGMIEDPEVGGIRDVMKKFGKGFKKKINKTAKAIAKNKIINKLRSAYVKTLQGPIADLGVKAGARALSAFGIPAKATELAINQRRAAIADRMKHGGYAGMVERASGKEGLKGVLKEVANRELNAGKSAVKKTISTLVPGMSLAQKAADHAKKWTASSISGDWDWLQNGD